MLRGYFYGLIARYIGLYVRPEEPLALISQPSEPLRAWFLWRPLLSLASRIGLRSKLPEQNWLAPEDMENFLRLSDFEPVKTDSKIICPVCIPLISGLLNRFVAPLPRLRFI